uniref:Serpin domain-containing protein n=1 Tax=Cyprinodon variegatus TaxID=28743 RepID=A0A3Q2DTQ1_CYPVA
MASPSPLSKANTTFCLDLLRKLNEDNNTANIFFSPFSISAALSMVMMGARGKTASQITTVKCESICLVFAQCLKTQSCQDDVHTLFAKLLNKLNQPEAPFALSVANRLYGEQSYGFLQVSHLYDGLNISLYMEPLNYNAVVYLHRTFKQNIN